MSESMLNRSGEPRISPWRAVVRVLTDPAATFRAMAANPPVLVPYLVHMLAGVVLMILAFGPTLEMTEMVQMQTISAMSAGEEIDLELARTMARWSVALTLGFNALIGPWLAGFFVSLVAMFFGQFQGGGVSLKSYMGMVGYARMPLAIHNLLAGVFSGITGQQLNLSAAAFLPDTASLGLIGLLGAINPLHIWYYILLGIGFAALFDREPRKGWALPVTLFVVTTLFSAASGALGSAFMTMN